MIWKRRFTKYSPIKAHGKSKPAAASKPSASHSITHGEVFRYMESPSERLAFHLCAEDKWGLYKIAIP